MGEINQMSNQLEEDVLEYISKDHPKFYQALWRIMDLKDVTVITLSRDSYLSKEQIYRYLKEKKYGGVVRYKTENIVSFCVAMHLNLKLSKKLIQIAGSPYNPKMCVKDRRYQYILKNAPIWNMDDVNRYIDRINETITEDHLSHLPNEKTYQRHLRMQEG